MISKEKNEQDQSFSSELIILQYYLFSKHVKGPESLHSALASMCVTGSANSKCSINAISFYL